MAQSQIVVVSTVGELRAVAETLDREELICSLVAMEVAKEAREAEIAELKAECKQMMDENGKTMKIAMGWREKYGELKAKNEELTKHYDKTMSKEHGWGNALMAENYEEKDLENEKLTEEVEKMTGQIQDLRLVYSCLKSQIIDALGLDEMAPAQDILAHARFIADSDLAVVSCQLHLEVEKLTGQIKDLHSQKKSVLNKMRRQGKTIATLLSQNNELIASSE